jgi:hypothetical protein
MVQTNYYFEGGKAMIAKRVSSLSLSLSLSLCTLLLLIGSAFGESLTPPPPPEIPPIISESYLSDQDGDKIDDSLLEEQFTLFSGGDPWVYVELIFKEQITQKQIDDFLLLGGEITYIYKALSYGWNGRIPLHHVETLPLLMGPALVQVEKPKQERHCMDVATQTGRVRPIWKNFAGKPLGFDGDPNIAIGIIDSGVDGTHMDLAGRKAYWMDQSGESPTDSVDYDGHGSYMAGIAVGTGASGGSGTGTLYYTYAFREPAYLHPCLNQNVSFPVSGCSFKSEACWNGGRALLPLFGFKQGDHEPGG